VSECWSVLTVSEAFSLGKLSVQLYLEVGEGPDDALEHGDTNILHMLDISRGREGRKGGEEEWS
jgi:hypothetical protein